ncbi:thermonuclease family protein [Massilibacterium senegalense]|uniref:thermonuclease family protein n=1 Tax=Massilibacterium senegalense TaxID=1632858 RepID=UPI0009EB1C7A|nr:thermonuclease family protein [Massilibacterium senegalense]
MDFLLYTVKILPLLVLSFIFILFLYKQSFIFNRKYIGIIASFILLFVVAGCSSTSTAESTKPNENIIKNEESTDTKENKQKQQENPEETVVNEEPQANIPAVEGVSLIPATVIRVTDGDTIKIRLDNEKEEKVRMILVDTPETVHPNKPVQPFGPEASQLTKDTLSGASIGLELGIEERDRYGRLLAYVYLQDGSMYNKTLIEKGLARVAVYPPNTKYLDEFKALEQQAKTEKLGIWSIEDYQSSSITNNSNQNNTSTSTTPTPSGSCDIKGNINSRGEKIYHMPGQQFYDKTNAEEIFCSEDEAQAAGYRKSLR